jgi:hypothetical protein
MRASLDGAALPAETAGTPTGAEWNDLALLAAIAAGTEPLRALSVDADRGPWISVAAACAIDLAAGDPRARQRLVDRAAGLARGESPALALLAADAAVRAGPANDPTRFAAWETLLDATPAARRGAVRAAILPKLPSLPPTGPAAAMGDLELAVRSLADPIPPDLAAEIAARGPIPETARGEAARLREFARLRVLASRGELVEAASLAERLANSLGDDPIAAAAAETLVLVRTSLASASTDALAWEAERSALEFAIGRFPRHPGHDRWAIDLALARLAAGESEGALEAVRRVGDASPLGDEARAVEAVALVRTGNAASIARAERLVRESAGGHPAVAARLALADALLMAAAGRIEDARGAADAVVADPTIPATIRAEALRIALELGATPPPHATGAILAALPRARAPLLAALRAGGDRDRTRSLLAALDGSQVALAPEELLAVAAATLAVGDAEPAARRAAEVIANAPRGTPVALAAMLLRAESLRAIGGEANLSEAFTLARDVLRQSAHASPGWWEANALQLEILEASGRNRDQVIPWINRLRAVDADLGGPATRSRIEAVAKRADS